MVAARPRDWGQPPEVHEILFKVGAHERVTADEVALLRAHMTPAEIAEAEDRWDITLDQILLPPVDLEDAPFEDEPQTPEEAAAVGEALASVERGELIPAAEVYRRLDL
jgi:hypothetical protein